MFKAHYDEALDRLDAVSCFTHSKVAYYYEREY